MKSERFTVQFTTENDAFTEEAATEVARIFRGLAAKIERGDHGQHGGDVRDINGNKVGYWTIEKLSS